MPAGMGKLGGMGGNMQTLKKILDKIEQEKLKHWDSSERLETDKLIGWCFDKCADIISNHMNDGWIPVEERLPDNAKYILLSFTNFSLPSIGRYEKIQRAVPFIWEIVMKMIHVSA